MCAYYSHNRLFQLLHQVKTKFTYMITISFLLLEKPRKRTLNSKCQSRFSNTCNINNFFILMTKAISTSSSKPVLTKNSTCCIKTNQVLYKITSLRIFSFSQLSLNRIVHYVGLNICIQNT